MRILLTGASGQVGSALRAPLSVFGTVIAADRTLIDLSRPADVTDALNNAAPDLIINPAAFTAVDQAELEPELAYRVNAQAPREMARWAASHGVPMIHFSTDCVFDGSGYRPWREDDATGPLSVYGASKLAGEIAVRGAGGSHLVIRTSWVFASKGRNFLSTIVRSARERNQLRVVSDQVGAPTSARLIAEGLTSILHCCRSGARNDHEQKFRQAGGLVHLTASGETSRHGFACAIVDGLRKRGEKLAVADIAAIKTGEYQARAARPHNSRLSLARLKTVFDISTSDWRQALDLELDDLACAAPLRS
ncbi:MAG: dTDP-4-dehydrorhamnose reductase [Bradyrhizobium sp.]|nr:dTDP-4-dehydrorhamnose reductase [Bradyrhizobium sp.]